MSGGRRSSRPEGTFYFQAWHVDKVVGGESWTSNKEMAEYVEHNLSPESKRWLCIRACIPTKSKASLAVPYSICVKRRAPKIGEEDEGEKCILQFRDKEYPSIAKRYFLTRLRKTLDFFNAYSEGVDPDSPLANFTEVKSSKQLSERVHARIRHIKNMKKHHHLADIVEGLLSSSHASGSEFKASKFISRRGQDPNKQNPHVLSTEPLQTILLGSGSDMRFASQESFQQLDDASSVGSAHSDDTTATSVSDHSAQAAEQQQQQQRQDEALEVENENENENDIDIDNDKDIDNENETCPAETVEDDEDNKEETEKEEVEEEEEVFVAGGSSSSPETSESNSRVVARRSSSNAAVITTANRGQYQMAYLMAKDAQMTFINIQNPRQMLQSIMSTTSKTSFNLPKGMDLFNSPMVFTTAGSPLQSLQADGTMRLFFLSKAKKAKKTIAPGLGEKPTNHKGGDDNVTKDKDTKQEEEEEEEWVVGSVKISTHRRRSSKGRARNGSITNSGAPIGGFLPLLPENSPPPTPSPTDDDFGSWEMVEEKEVAESRVVEIIQEDQVRVQEEEIEKEDHHPHGKDDMCSANCYSAHCGKPRRKTKIPDREKHLFQLETKPAVTHRTVKPEAAAVDLDASSEEKEKATGRKRRSKTRGSSISTNARSLRTKRTMDSMSSAYTAATTTTTASHMSGSSTASRAARKYQFRESWRSEAQPPELFCDVVNGANFMQVEDFEVFSFSAMTQDTLQRYAGGFEDSDGIDVWGPPPMKVVGVLSWMWDHFNVNPWGKAAP